MRKYHKDYLINVYCCTHHTDVQAAKYKIGQLVKWKHPEEGTGEGTIVGMAHTGDEVEYAVSDCNWLLWEADLSVD